MAGLPSTGPTPHQLITPRQTGTFQILAPTAWAEEDVSLGTFVRVSFSPRAYPLLFRARSLISSPRNLSASITKELLVPKAAKIPRLKGSTMGQPDPHTATPRSIYGNSFEQLPSGISCFQNQPTLQPTKNPAFRGRLGKPGFVSFPQKRNGRNRS